MRKYNIFIAIILLLSISMVMVSAVGCSADRSRFDVAGHTENLTEPMITSEEIKKIVTDDEKLVINYYNAYIWVIYFDDTGAVELMSYIYSFSDSQEAAYMIDIRKEELLKNKTMTILRAYSADEFLVVELTDTSFTNISRSLLETNFSGLVVY